MRYTQIETAAEVAWFDPVQASGIAPVLTAHGIAALGEGASFWGSLRHAEGATVFASSPSFRATRLSSPVTGMNAAVLLDDFLAPSLITDCAALADDRARQAFQIAQGRRRFTTTCDEQNAEKKN